MARGTDRGKRPARARAVASEVVDTARRIHATTAPTPSGSWSARDGSGRGGGGGASRRSNPRGRASAVSSARGASARTSRGQEEGEARASSSERSYTEDGGRSGSSAHVSAGVGARARRGTRRAAIRARLGPDAVVQIRAKHERRARRATVRARSPNRREGRRTRARPSRADPGAPRAEAVATARIVSALLTANSERTSHQIFQHRPRELVVSASRDFRAR